MILIDLNQMVFANLFQVLAEGPLDEGLMRHFILNTMRTYVHKFRHTYGPEVVVAMDNRHYWRRDIFPQYKHGRKKSREASGIDWTTVFQILDHLREEFKTSLPYHVLDVDGAEADDIIGTLCYKYGPQEKIIILSSDKDFIQLQSIPGVVQYSPILKKMIQDPFPTAHLKQLIIRGDTGDGIPNILSVDNAFTDKIRQKPILEAKLIKWMNQDPTDFCTTEMLRNYHRNKQLIDLTQIPATLQGQILSSYETVLPAAKTVFLNYLIQAKLKNLIEVADEF